MAEEIVFFAAKCHKSHLKAQKEAALFLRNLLELICAGVTCEKQSRPSAPPPLPSPHSTPHATGFQALGKSRTVWVGDPGSRVSKSEPARRENWRRGRKSCRPLPAWWVQGARGGIRPRAPRGATVSSPRRDLCVPPPARTPRPLEREHKGSRGCLDASRLS